MERLPRMKRVAIGVVLLLFFFFLPLNTASARSQEDPAFLRLQELIKKIKDNYAGKVDEAELWEGALRGMVAALNDPYSTYLSEEELARFLADTRGTFGGVGLILTNLGLETVVISSLHGTPAAGAGLVAGDRIIAVDGRDVGGMPADWVVDLIRGEPGTKVVLTVRREEQEFTVELTRELIEINPIEGKTLADGIGYIAIAYFNEHTERKLLEVLRDFEGQGVRALILDLRSNPGGFFTQALAVVRQFAPQGPILQLVERDGKSQTFFAYEDRNRWPLVILVDEGTASASEIVAGVLQDLGVATLIGVPTFGKGSVQSVIPLEGGGAVKLTTARYLTPSGRPIPEGGLKPDILVKQPAPGGLGPFQLRRVLSRGSGGLDVAWLQEVLVALGYEIGEIDGIFGGETEAAVRSFQGEAGLTVTGVVDRETAEALNRALAGAAGDRQLERAIQVLKERLQAEGEASRLWQPPAFWK